MDGFMDGRGGTLHIVDVAKLGSYQQDSFLLS
jgi:hypothetical protein